MRDEIAGRKLNREARYKCLLVSADLLVSVLSLGEHDGYVVIKEEIPEATILVNVRHRWPDNVELLLYNAKWDIVTKDQEIPQLTPLLQKRT